MKFRLTMAESDHRSGKAPPPPPPPGGVFIPKPPEFNTLNLRKGTKVGRYVLSQRVGKGGMGVVYVAYDPDLDRKVAIKILNPLKEGANAGAAKQRLLREARAMAQVEHPNLCQVFDVGPYEDMVFIAMEFVQGRTLREWRAEVRPDDWEDILHVYSSAAKALTAVHEAGLVHRDFKPENVMLGFDSRVRVMDLGLARTVASLDNLSSENSSNPQWRFEALTQTGVIMGTPAYMAPEQFLGQPATSAADQFSFCVALFEALYGFRPFKGRVASEVAAAVLRGRIRLPKRAKTPSWVLDVLLRGLQSNPDDRFETMRDLYVALQGPVRKEYRHPYMFYTITALAGLLGTALYWKGTQELERSEALETAHALEVQRLELKVRSLETELSRPPEYPGSLPPEVVEEVTRKHSADIRLCQRHRSKEPLNGVIEYDFTVDADGVPLRAALFRNHTLDGDLARCVRGMALTWDFPPPQGGEARFLLSIPFQK